MHHLYTAAVLSLLSALAGTQSIDPNSVPIGTRKTWCTNQIASCPLLCTQIGASNSPESNTCDPNSLAYTCICSNNQSPNASAFSQTIPFYECQQAGVQCADNCNGDNACVSACQTSHPCGAQSPPRINATSSTSSAASSATGSSGGASGTSGGGAASTSGGSGGGSAATGGFLGSSATPSSSAGGALLVPRVVGMAETGGLVVLLGFLGGMAFIL